MEQKSTTPLYRIISDDLKTKIRSGDFSYDSPICTEASLCREYNVSRITAKRAIMDLEHENILSRKRGVGSFVVPLEKRDNYCRNAPPAGGDTAYRSLSLMIPFSTTQGGIFKAIESATDMLARSNCYLTLNVYTPGIENEYSMLQTLYNNTDGVIYYPSSTKLPTEALERFSKSGRPVIILDKPHSDPQFSSITCDNFRGGYLLTEHLISYGHRNICYLSRFTADEISSIRDRYAGYCSCLKDNGIEETRFIYLDTSRDNRPNYPMLKHIINTLRREGVTAIECENDEVAFYVHMCCQSLAIRTSEDMSITGFDNISWATMGSAHITTVEQDFEQIGKSVAELILNKQYSPEHRIIPVRLVPRNSTGPAI